VLYQRFPGIRRPLLPRIVARRKPLILGVGACWERRDRMLGDWIPHRGYPVPHRTRLQVLGAKTAPVVERAAIPLFAMGCDEIPTASSISGERTAQ